MESGGTKMTLSIKNWSEDGEAKIPIPNSFFLVFSRKCTAIAVGGVNMDIFYLREFVEIGFTSYRVFCIIIYVNPAFSMLRNFWT